MTNEPTPETDAMFTDNVPEDAQIVAFCERLERERNALRAERDELNRQLSVALKGKRPYSSKFADETIASQVKRIAELEEKLNGWFSERNAARAERDDARADVARLRAALELIASPMRPDGTYNRDRAACGTLASEALNSLLQ